MIDDELKRWINNASYRDLLYRWRFAPDNDPVFHGETGDYYAKVMKKKGEEIGNDARVKASKNVGW